MARILQGKSFSWQLGDQPIGSGDAGEVYPVSCVEDPDIKGVMKKPAQIATGGTIMRQAGQIAQESLALATLDGLPKCKAHPPRLLDVSPDFTRGTANYFMVSETAPGEDMAAMLLMYRQSGKPFPRRVIITVLDALFDLFARAHHAGVLWNDVKLDHIYWHNPTGQVAVIDWGNAQFLNKNNDNENRRRSLPRWEDYQQLVNTLGGFLKQYTPDLYTDLGWDEFQGKELDLPQVSVLARRIAYQQQVIGLRVMEYQALIQVVLSTDPGLEGLERILNYQHLLEEIGAPWDSEAILVYSKSLVLSLLIEKRTQRAITATSMVWGLFDDRLDLSWHLLREYFRIPDLIAHKDLYMLVNNTLNNHWSSALWRLTAIARELQDADWWERLAPVLHQKITDAAEPRPSQTGRSLLAWAKSTRSLDENKVKQLSTILQNWRRKGESFEENPFDYALLAFIKEDQIIPKRIISEVKQSFAQGQEALREVVKAWTNMDWEALIKSLRGVLAWDPDRWGILYLADSVDAFQVWMERLYEGPLPGRDPLKFFNQIVTEQPKIDRILGRPPWYKSLINMISALNNGEPVSKVKIEATYWCPWLLDYNTIYDGTQKSNADERAVEETLIHFAKHLKNWSSLDHGVERVKREALHYYPTCKKILNHFKSIVNLNADITSFNLDCDNPPHSALVETCRVLQTVVTWRAALVDGEFQKALAIIDSSEHRDWRILAHIQNATANWIDEIHPFLVSIARQEIPKTVDIPKNQGDAMTSIVNNASELKSLWQKIYDTGINTQLIERMTSLTDKNRGCFLEWRRSYEHTNDLVKALLYHFDLELIRDISNDFLRLSQHSRQAQLSFSELRQAKDIPIAATMAICDRLLTHLEKMEGILVRDTKARAFPGWIEDFQQVSNARTKRESMELILNISNDHPLYAWLVQSLLA